jgi:pyruvate/2-oxoglutarate dehydrogenase complex dihydrolipoamide acyltransferase (E2) component
VKEGQTLLEVETDKVTFEIPAEAAGEIVEVLVTKGAKVAPGDILATLKTKSVEPANGVVVSELPNTLTMAPAISTLLEVTNPVEMQATNNNRAPEISFPYGDKKVVTTPLARKLARELDIDISEIQKAVKGRITFLDVKNYAKSQLRQASRNDSVSATVHSPPYPTLNDMVP